MSPKLNSASSVQQKRFCRFELEDTIGSIMTVISLLIWNLTHKDLFIFCCQIFGHPKSLLYDNFVDISFVASLCDPLLELDQIYFHFSWQTHEFFVDMTCEGCSGAVTRVLKKLGRLLNISYIFQSPAVRPLNCVY